MKLKINWGGGIVIAIIVMVTGMLVLVFIATRQDYFLVEKDYYQKAVNYQDQIDKINNANLLKEKVSINYIDQSLIIQFPKIFQNQPLEGKIVLYSPVNEKLDATLTLKLDSALMQLISLKEIPEGRYKVKLDWIGNEKSFYQEMELIHQ